MSALKLIVHREYTSRVRKKSFILVTIFMPLIIVGLVLGTLFLAQIKDTDEKKILVIDNTGKYTSHLQDFDYYEFVRNEQDISKAKSQVGKEFFGTLIISDDLNTNAQGVTFYSEKQPSAELLSYLNNILSDEVKNVKLDNLTLSGTVDKETIILIQQITEAPNSINVSTIRLDDKGNETETSTALATIIGMVSTMLMYIFIITYGSMVMQGVIEEKSNRIVEVMISSVSPFDLMMGKIIGVFLVGFTQLMIWIVTCVVLYNAIISFFLPQFSTGEVSAMLQMIPNINWGEIVLFFFLFFIAGYLIYAALFAMFGSAVDNPQDSQQFVTPITFIFIFALYAGIYSLNNPNGPLAFWSSMFPLTSPVVMMVRVPFGIPLWEEITSIAILVVTSLLVIKIAAKIYRVGILMYGKKPSFSELVKWMKYK